MDRVKDNLRYNDSFLNHEERMNFFFNGIEKMAKHLKN